MRGTLTDVYNENTRTQVEASNSTLYPVIRTVLDSPGLEHGKRLERRLPSNTETGSSESEGVERKDAARRMTRAREPGHLMRLPRSHPTRRSQEA